MSETVRSDSTLRRALALAVPFGVVGLALGHWGSRAVVTMEAPLQATLLSGVLAAALGAAWGAVFRRGRGRIVGLLLGFAFAVSVVACGAAVGAGFAALEHSPRFTGDARVFDGAWLGVMLGLVSGLPALGLVVAAHRRSLESRAGSIVRVSGRRQVWRAVALALAVTGWIASRHGDAWLAPAIAGTCMLVWLALRDAAELVGLFQRLNSGVERIVDDEAVPTDAPVIDLGLGDENWIARGDRHHPYRGRARAYFVLRGALFSVQALLMRRTLFGALTALAAGFAFLVRAFAVADEPPVPVSVATPPPAVVAQPVSAPHLSWLGQQRPIVVPQPDGAPEDVVGLRWNSGAEVNALSVTRTNGSDLTTRWQTTPIHSQWASDHTKLAVSGDRVFLSDSEGLLHIYDLANGVEVGPASELPGVFQMCGRDDGVSQIWVRARNGGGIHDREVIVDADGTLTTAERPAWCHDQESACGKPLTNDRVCERQRTLPAGLWGTSREEGDAGVSFVAKQLPSGAYVQAWRLFGYDPSTNKPRWSSDAPLSADPPHADPHLKVELGHGRLFESYQLKSGSWKLGARSAASGTVLWQREPPHAVYGTNFVSMTVSKARLYVVIDWRVEVIDPTTGDSIGVIW